MAEIRTQRATVARLAGSKGVTVKETTTVGEREFSTYFTVWLGDGHGLNVGDSARFYGDLSVKKNERNGTTYFDLNINRATVLEGTLERAAQPESWVSGNDQGQGWGR